MDCPTSSKARANKIYLFRQIITTRKRGQNNVRVKNKKI